MMPPSIRSEKYYTSADGPSNPQAEPFEPVLEVHHPSLLTIKDDLHDEISRIFANTTKPTLPPFSLPAMWDSPTSRQSGVSHSFASNRTHDSAGSSVSSQGSSFGTDSFDSLFFSPSVTNTPTHSSDYRRSSDYGGSSGSGPLVGLGLGGLYNLDGTPFTGFGLLQSVDYAKSHQPNLPPHPHPYHGSGLGLYGEGQTNWEWAGDEVLFDVDGDATMVDVNELFNGRREWQSADLSRRQCHLPSPDFSKDAPSSDLDRLFRDISGQSSTSKPSRGGLEDTHPSRARTGRWPHSKLLSKVSTSSRNPRLANKNMARDDVHRLTHTVPLPPSTEDVFYRSPAFTPADLTMTAPLTPASSRDVVSRAPQYPRLRKDGKDFQTWSLPPVSWSAKKARF